MLTILRDDFEHPVARPRWRIQYDSLLSGIGGAKFATLSTVMTFRLSQTAPTWIILVAATLLASPVSSAPKTGSDARNLAKQLGPTPPGKSSQASSVGKLSARMISIIEVLEKSYRSNGPNPESLIDKAFEYRADVGNWEAMMMSRALISAWKDANAMDLFNENGKFGTTIYKGRGTGNRVLFELIIPADVYPPASNQLANLRLVRESEKRVSTTEMGQRERAYYDQLVKMINERSDLMKAVAVNKKDNKEDASRQGPATNALGQTTQEQDKLWEQSVAAAGDAANATPRIRTSAHMEASPSNMTKNRWRVKCDFGNSSGHPTEVKAEVWLIGYTDEKRDHYIMAKSEHTLKLRPGETRQIDVFTKAEKSYKAKADNHDGLSKQERKKSRVRYRGYAIRVLHNKDIISFAGSDSLLTRYVDPDAADSPLSRLPQY